MTTKNAISQLKPFSAKRFDACMNYLMHEYDLTLSQYDITKLHVPIDFFHVLETGKQVIGGVLSPWDLGPVIKPGYNRVRSLGHRFNDEKKPVRDGKLRVTGKRSEKIFNYSPYGSVEKFEFSPSELNAMRLAWEELIPKTWKERKSFFHGKTNFMGKVWSQAKSQQQEIDWGDLIEAYDRQHGTDHTGSRLLIDLWREP